MATVQKIDDDLRSLGKIKDIMQNIFYNDEDIRNLVMPTLDNSNYSEFDNFFGGKNIPYTDKNGSTTYTDLLGHCFDIPYVPSTITDNRAIICMESYIVGIDNTYIKEIHIDIYPFAHKDFVHMSSSEKAKYKKKGYYGNRIDMLTTAIQLAVKNASETFSQEVAIGNIQLAPRVPITPYQPNNDFYGRTISYVCKDFYIKPKNKA